MIEQIIAPGRKPDAEFGGRLAAFIVSWAVLYDVGFRTALERRLDDVAPTLTARGVSEICVGEAAVSDEVFEHLCDLVMGNSFAGYVLNASGIWKQQLRHRLCWEVGRAIRARPDWSEIKHRIQRDVRRAKTVRKVIDT